MKKTDKFKSMNNLIQNNFLFSFAALSLLTKEFIDTHPH